MPRPTIRARPAAALLLTVLLPVSALAQSPSPTVEPSASAAPPGPIVSSVCPAADASPAPSAASSPSASLPPHDGPTPPPIATDPAVARTRSPGRMPGTWTRLPGAPLTPRTDAAIAWTAQQTSDLLIWGGVSEDGSPLMDGATWDPTTNAWRMMAPSPLGPRTDMAWVWDNVGLFVYGGRSPDGTWLTDGAWYNPDEDAWFPLNGTSPLPAGPAVADGDLNGISVVVPDPCGGAPWWALYEPGDIEESRGQLPNVWSGAEQLPLPPGARYEVVASAYDQALILSYPEPGQPVAVRYEERPRRFRQLGVLPVPAAGPVGIAGRFAVAAWAGTDAGTGLPSVVIADLDRVRRPWTLTDVPPVSVAGDEALVMAPDALISPAGMVAWDLATGRWLRIPQRGSRARTNVAAAWGDGRLFLWGGRDADGRLRDDGWAFRPSLGKGVIALPGGYPGGGDCGGVGINGVWRLRGDPEDERLVWFQQGRLQVPTRWPDGYGVRFRDGTFVVLGPDGKVVAREGDMVREPSRPGDLDPCWTGDGAWF